jgi:alpha-glucosidase
LHNFLASQPDLNFHNPEVQDALLETVRFWLDRGVDGFRLDTVNYYVHDRWLRDNPPTAESASGLAAETNPYLLQLHLFDKTQPENLGFLRRFRALLDSHGGRMSVGEVGDEWRSLQTVAAYTGGGDALHMCYTFDLLGPEFSAAHVKKSIAAFETGVADGWICWAFSNHDVMRHVSRWTKPGGDTDATARFAIGLLACLRGSICLYEGEELGLEEAELAFEDIRDPYGIRFWPGFKGRDGCRTPMPWEHAAHAGGFTTGKPWLPVPDAHKARAVDAQVDVPDSILSHYRAVLAFRAARPALVTGSIELLEAPEDVLVFLRGGGGGNFICAFNFSDEAVECVLPAGLGAISDAGLPAAGGSVDKMTLSLPPLGSFVGTVG